MYFQFSLASPTLFGTKPKLHRYLVLMESQKDVERREGGCQSERLPDSLAGTLATSYLGRQHDTVDFESDKHEFSSQLCCALTVSPWASASISLTFFFFFLINAVNNNNT